ncbi:hypothetical protein EJ02DRAFT_106293 [Clathrospora elynae]|uniref:Secreted protein n=1 Tax=Clathrospora elynae TaxID=706981 RepID=A0A6A5S8B0_9PLEO|nr:hypothetical protein EJ02DRAFT_106293 [Clathrospora elynae]
MRKICLANLLFLFIVYFRCDSYLLWHRKACYGTASLGNRFLQEQAGENKQQHLCAYSRVATSTRASSVYLTAMHCNKEGIYRARLEAFSVKYKQRRTKACCM